MRLCVRFLFIAVAIPTIIYLHILAIWFGVALTRHQPALEWPILGGALLSLIATTTLAITIIFREKKQ